MFGRETANSITGDDFLKLIGREELMIIQQGKRSNVTKAQLPPIGEKVTSLIYYPDGPDISFAIQSLLKYYNFCKNILKNRFSWPLN